MKKKILILVSALAISTVALTACGDSNADNSQTTTEAAQSDTSAQPDDTAKKPDREMGKRVVGQVTAINDKNVTIKTANMPEKPEAMSEDTSLEQAPQGEKPQEPNGQMPNGEAPQAPNGEDKPQEPPMDKPADGSEPKEMTFDGEEQTLEVDETKLFKEGENPEDRENASLSDIKEGSVLTFVYEDDGETVKEILLKTE